MKRSDRGPRAPHVGGLRRGAAYLGVVLGLVSVLTLLMILSSRLSRDTRRARILGTVGKGLVRLQQARDQVEVLCRAGTLPPLTSSMKVSGSLVTLYRHARSESSNQFVFFAHWVERDVDATLAFDVEIGPQSVTVDGEDLYVGVGDPALESVRQELLVRRRAALRQRCEVETGWARMRRDGRFHQKLETFLGSALDGTIPEGDRTRILSGAWSVQPDLEDESERETRGSDPPGDGPEG